MRLFRWFSNTVAMWINDNMSGGMKRPFWMLKREQMTTIEILNSRTWTQCLKITKKVAFNIASEASYVYMSFLKGQKLVENAKIQKFKCDFLSDFQTLCFLFITYFLNGIIDWMDPFGQWSIIGKENESRFATVKYGK